MSRPEKCGLCGTELTLSNTKAGEGHMVRNCAQVLYAQRNEARDAISAAGFRVAPDLLGKPTLWCIECGRDSGFHHSTCSKGGTTTTTVITGNVDTLNM